MYQRKSLIFLLSIICVFCAYSGLTFANDEYVIGPEDVLQISFWQEPSLDQIVKVRQDGKITLSIIGEIQASGLTSSELATQIERNVSLYNQKISQATVTVTGFNSQKVFVSGEVGVTGKITFEVIPDIWTVIREAGGATELGDLTRVSIIRSDEDGGEMITVNVLEALASGSLDRLPKLKSGDTVDIPRAAGGLPGRQLTSDYGERKNLFYVIGEVNRPGQLEFDGEVDILDAIGLAGGTTERANLKDVRIITKNGSGTSVIKTNLKKYQKEGNPKRLTIKREDTIVIGQKGRPWISWDNLRDFAMITTSIVTLYLLIDRTRDDEIR
ncbi:MAG: polysaccharide biosynthesis/export family protein [candidate division Zixibacteria bacterium]